MIRLACGTVYREKPNDCNVSVHRAIHDRVLSARPRTLDLGGTVVHFDLQPRFAVASVSGRADTTACRKARNRHAQCRTIERWQSVTWSIR